MEYPIIPYRDQNCNRDQNSIWLNKKNPRWGSFMHSCSKFHSSLLRLCRLPPAESKAVFASRRPDKALAVGWSFVLQLCTVHEKADTVPFSFLPIKKCATEATHRKMRHSNRCDTNLENPTRRTLNRGHIFTNGNVSNLFGFNSLNLNSCRNSYFTTTNPIRQLKTIWLIFINHRLT